MASLVKLLKPLNLCIFERKWMIKTLFALSLSTYGFSMAQEPRFYVRWNLDDPAESDERQHILAQRDQGVI